jgi:hypothetical protein
MGEEGLATILRKSRLIDLITVIDRGAIEETLEREDFRALILPAGVGGEADHRRFLEIRPDICVLIIDLAKSETSLQFRDIDGETLARLVNSLSEPPARMSPRQSLIARDAASDVIACATVRGSQTSEFPREESRQSAIR